MTQWLEGKSAVITGGGNGIGRATALEMAQQGAKVVVADIGKDANGARAADKVVAEIVGKNGVAAASYGNVATPEGAAEIVETATKNFGRLDILVNCAGYVHQGTVFDCTDKDWDFSFDLNVKSMHRMIKTFLPAMLEKKYGSIVNISSAVSSIRGVPNRYVYGTTKAAVIGLTKGSRRISSNKASAATPSARARSNRRRWASASARCRRRAGAH